MEGGEPCGNCPAFEDMNFGGVNSSENARLLIDLSSPFTLEHGLLDMAIQDGIVSSSVATGIFAGLLPPTGTAGPFTVPLGDLAVDFDFGSFNGDNTDLMLNLSDQGSALASAVNPLPEPSILVMFAIGFSFFVLRYAFRAKRVKVDHAGLR